MEKGCPLALQTRGLGERHELPQPGLDGAAAANDFQSTFECHGTLDVKEKMQYFCTVTDKVDNYAEIVCKNI